jgi:hypothetical protein
MADARPPIKVHDVADEKHKDYSGQYATVNDFIAGRPRFR